METGSSCRHPRRRLAALSLPLLDEANQLRDQVRDRGELGDRRPGALEIGANRLPLPVGGALEGQSQTGVTRLNQEPPTALGILDSADPHVPARTLARGGDPA